LDTVTLKLVTIVAERILKDRVVADVLSAGARGYTITDAYGKGSRGVRASEWEGPDVKIEAVVSNEVADRIMEHISATYFKHYAVIAYTETVDVVRGDKYI
jgi:nitrogen regulatory protein P-II 2